MQPINCIIIDDEPLAIKLMNDYASKVPELTILYAGIDVYEAISVLKTKQIDLVFIDIQMPDLTGIELMEMFNANHNFIITSAYQEYALKSFEFNVVDFLLKPITFNRFYKSIEKYKQWNTIIKNETIEDFFYVKSERKHFKIFFNDILYIEGMKDYIRIHTNDDKIIVLDNMKDVISKLPDNDFMRIHRSYIIPTAKIKIIEGNRIQLQNLEYIPIGETYRKLVAEWLDKISHNEKGRRNN